jgi:pimeloyl-ACP methyl ester carboxylesterase
LDVRRPLAVRAALLRRPPRLRTSDKPDDAALYTIERHRTRLASLLDALDLRAVTLVPHDWSGPIALPWAVANPARVERLFVPSTFPPRLPGPIGARASLRAFRTRGLGSFLVKRRNVPVERFLLGAGLAAPRALDAQDAAAYRAPHRDGAARTAVLAFPRQIPFRARGRSRRRQPSSRPGCAATFSASRPSCAAA